MKVSPILCSQHLTGASGGCQVLEDEGVYKDLNVGEYNLEFVAVEEDVISLEVDTVYRVRTWNCPPRI